MPKPSPYPLLALTGLLAAITLGGAYAHLAGLWIWLDGIAPITWLLALVVALGLGLIIGGAGVWVGVALLRQDVQRIPDQICDRIFDLDDENTALNHRLDQAEGVLALLLEPELLTEGKECPYCGSKHPGLEKNPWSVQHHNPLLVLDAQGEEAWIDCPIALGAQLAGGQELPPSGAAVANSFPPLSHL